MEKIKMFKSISGEFIIAGVKNSDSAAIELDYPAVIIPIQQGQIGFNMFAPFSDHDKTIAMSINNVAMESTPDTQIKEAYIQWRTQVKAQKSGIITTNRMPQAPLPGNGRKADFSKLNT